METVSQPTALCTLEYTVVRTHRQIKKFKQSKMASNKVICDCSVGGIAIEAISPLATTSSSSLNCTVLTAGKFI